MYTLSLDIQLQHKPGIEWGSKNHPSGVDFVIRMTLNEGRNE